MQSLRDFLEQLPATNVLHIRDVVDKDYVPTAMVLELEKRNRFPVLYLHEVDGSDIPIVVNMFGDRERIARAAGTTLSEFDESIRKAGANLIKPEIVTEGPCQETVSTGKNASVTHLPISRHFQADAAPYIGSGILVSKDPDTGIRNLSFQRLQYKDKNRFGVSLHSRGHIWDHLQRARAQGKHLQVAVFIGAHPALYLAASARVAMDVDEYDIAGGILGEAVELVQCETIDREVPAHAEIVLEGEILADVEEPEGPFGEYPGYSTDRSTNNVFQISAVTSRQAPIYQDLIPGNSAEHLQLAQTTKQAHIFGRLKEFVPQVTALAYPKSGTNFHAYIQLNQTAPGQARHAIMLLLGLDHYTKLAISVDEDVDVNDEAEVMWAVATRMQAGRDTFVVPDVFCNRLDPSSSGGVSDKMGIDATAPLDWPGVERIVVPEVARSQALKILAKDE